MLYMGYWKEITFSTNVQLIIWISSVLTYVLREKKLSIEYNYLSMYMHVIYQELPSSQGSYLYSLNSRWLKVYVKHKE